MTLVELARQLRPIIEQAVSTALDDVTALRSVPLFPKWAPDISVKKNERYQYNGVLYKVSQDHTTQAGWTPDKTPALWVAVAADPEQGTAENPITAVRGMEYTYGLYYHCFACGEHGDVIDLTAKLFDLRLYDAARKLASDFHLAPDKPLPEAIRWKKKHKTRAQQLRENEQLCFSVLNEYRRLLLDWEKRYAPQTPEDVLDERFVEACHRLPWAEYQLDVLLQGDSYERGETVSNLTADGYICKLQARLREEQYHEQPCLDR